MAGINDEQRNEFVHGKDEATKWPTKAKLNVAVVKAFDKDRAERCSSKQHIGIIETGAEVEQQLAETIQHWLETIRLAAETGRRMSKTVAS
jgi:hypothetical protein